jgi:tetratricopeptide (TPR) repeat protein
MKDYEGVIDRLNSWLAEAESPGPEPYRLLALAYYQLQRCGDALQPIQTAISLVESKDQKVDESWYGLLRVLYYELKDYDKVIEVLKVLIEEYPSKDYWLMLAAMYGEAGMERHQLGAYEAAYLQGFLQSGDEISLFAQLLLQANVPYRAALVLERAIEDSTIAADARNYRVLSQAWTLAKEDAKAIEALKAAAGLSGDGEPDARLAQAYLNTDAWEKAAESARTALRKGIEKEHEVQLLLGMALFQLDRFEEAKNAFGAAMTGEASRQLAANWISYIEKEQSRISELRATLSR